MAMLAHEPGQRRTSAVISPSGSFGIRVCQSVVPEFCDDLDDLVDAGEVCEQESHEVADTRGLVGFAGEGAAPHQDFPGVGDRGVCGCEGMGAPSELEIDLRSCGD
jgi:hypothetical protein